MVETYLEDEHILQSAILCLISVLSFYPTVYFLNQQNGKRLGRRMFDQMMLYAIMFMTFAHFLAEQKFMQAYIFIPLSSWHKLVNTFLLIEQCSLVLFLGQLSGTISHEIEAMLFGVNILLILIM